VFKNSLYLGSIAFAVLLPVILLIAGSKWVPFLDVFIWRWRRPRRRGQNKSAANFLRYSIFFCDLMGYDQYTQEVCSSFKNL
jgi:hypothetical protein